MVTKPMVTAWVKNRRLHILLQYRNGGHKRSRGRDFHPLYYGRYICLTKRCAKALLKEVQKMREKRYERLMGARLRAIADSRSPASYNRNARKFLVLAGSHLYGYNKKLLRTNYKVLPFPTLVMEDVIQALLPYCSASTAPKTSRYLLRWYELA